ncbi:tumor protein p63-regulated gene 1-like protein isoform X1 [Nematostella vectensis]|uniref:tumor protein p63-regulated gene 1-like protein isoform X1 n=1 Tax=Nematostella vectensis TaxID=45351 RepID=UPI00138FAB29|nr:tumor protein p63-regulated gene 1-like protein isoform X1 [Nematostella vectensis]
MAEGVIRPPSYEQSLHDHPAMDTQTPPQYKESSDRGSTQQSEERADHLPNVEVRGNPIHSEVHLGDTSGLTSEELKELQEKTKREQAKKYFSLREGQFESALEECKKILHPEKDGKIINGYLLTEIDHWDHEKERVVIITEKQLVIVKYNFIGLRVDDHRKIPLIKCDKIQTGRFVYPKNTMMMLTGYADNNPRVIQHGVRIHLCRMEPTLFQNWNPFNSDMPFISFTDHQSVTLLEDAPSHLSIANFQRHFIDSINAARVAEPNKELLHNFEVTEEDLPIQIYVGLSAMVVNQSKLGFCKDRGNVFY